MTRTLPKPQITVRKDDESAYVDATKFWSLSLTARDGNDDDITYELRVRHDAKGDDFTFWSIDRGDRDDIRLYDLSEWHDYLDAIGENEGLSKQDSIAFAHAHGRHLAVLHEHEILAHLRATWDAFVLLFNPAYAY